jgi:hypothetical protein
MQSDIPSAGESEEKKKMAIVPIKLHCGLLNLSLPGEKGNEILLKSALSTVHGPKQEQSRR